MKEGYLIRREDERFELRSREDDYLTYFTSGDSIELYVEHYGWVAGRIEYSDDMGGYYFYSEDNRHRTLRSGLKARTV